MNANTLSTEYQNGVEEFIKFVVEHVNEVNRIKRPCIRCDCLDKVSVEVLRDHLFINGNNKGHTRQI